jgi:hypothetical protein
MKIATKIIFASALTFSAVAPTFAHAAYLQNTSQIRTTGAPEQHVIDKSVRAVRGLDAMAYVPTDVSDGYPRDFGIGSQR